MATEIVIDSDLNVNGNLYDGYNIVGFNNVNDFNKVTVYTCDSKGNRKYSITKYSSMINIAINNNNTIDEIELYSGHSESVYIKIYEPVEKMIIKLEENHTISIHLIG